MQALALPLLAEFWESGASSLEFVGKFGLLVAWKVWVKCVTRQGRSGEFDFPPSAILAAQCSVLENRAWLTTTRYLHSRPLLPTLSST